jgi:hypothetical protein
MEKRKKAKTSFAYFALSSLEEGILRRRSDALSQRTQSFNRHHNRLHSAVNNHMAALQVRLPGALARVQRMATRLPEALVLACEITCCHRETSCYFRKTF